MASAATPTAPHSAADLRALVARAAIPKYRIAAQAGINTSSFSAYLTGRFPLTPELAVRIATAIAECAAQHGAVR